MQVQDRVRNALYAAIDDINLLLPEDQRLETSPDVPLVGSNGTLDSLGVVNFVIAAEQKIYEEFDKTVSLTEMLSAQDVNQFETVGSLCEVLTNKLVTESRENGS